MSNRWKSTQHTQWKQCGSARVSAQQGDADPIINQCCEKVGKSPHSHRNWQIETKRAKTELMFTDGSVRKLPGFYCPILVISCSPLTVFPPLLSPIFLPPLVQLTSAYLSYCCLSAVWNQFAHSPLTSYTKSFSCCCCNRCSSLRWLDVKTSRSACWWMFSVTQVKGNSWLELNSTGLKHPWKIKRSPVEYSVFWRTHCRVVNWCTPPQSLCVRWKHAAE